MSDSSKLGLGTVQWGMTYGIANSEGRPTASIVAQMLQTAQEAGIDLLDTAHAYGEAEEVLGNQRAASKNFKIVTKTKPLNSTEITSQEVSAVSGAFQLSLQRLGISRIYGLLVHNADSLLKQGGGLIWEVLKNLRSEGLVEKVGVSVYHPQQLKDILDRYEIDLVQLPFSVYDQRFAQAGLLQRLKLSKVEVHARSVFLQGLLLMSPEQLPHHFNLIRAQHAQLHALFRDVNLTPLEGSLLYCLHQLYIDRIIVGCETPHQLAEICGTLKKQTPEALSAVSEFALQDEAYLNPSLWL